MPFFWSKCNFNGRIDHVWIEGLGAVEYLSSLARWIQDFREMWLLLVLESLGGGLIGEHHAQSPGALHRNISGCAIALPRAKEVQCQVCDTDPV